MPSLSIGREQSLYAGYASGAIPSIRRDLASYQEQLSTGKRINRPSDDPGGFAQARALESLEARYGQYTRTVNDAQLWTDRSQSALDNLTERFTDAYEKGIQGLNDTLGADERATLANHIESLLGEVVDGLNEKSGNEYLFAGTRTTTEPFAADGTATGDLSGRRNRQIGPNVELAINIPGSDVHDTGAGYTITESLQGLADALRGTGPLELDEAVARVEVSRDHLLDRVTDIGNIASRLNLAEVRLADATTEVASHRSVVEDADFFEVASKFQSSQTALEAALRTTASVSQTTLLDYLR